MRINISNVMERLTRGYLSGNYSAIEQKCDCVKSGELGFYKAINKLGQLEDIEEELKCPLDFVATPYGLVGLRKIWYRKQYCEVIRIVAYEEGTRPYMEVRVEGLKYLKMVCLEDYGKTWALTKEELENERVR